MDKDAHDPNIYTESTLSQNDDKQNTVYQHQWNNLMSQSHFLGLNEVIPGQALSSPL